MKLIALVGTLVLTLSLASPAQAKEKDDTVAATREPAGQIQHSRDGSEFKAIPVGFRVKEGDRVLVGQDSKVTLRYDNNCDVTYDKAGVYTVDSSCVAGWLWGDAAKVAGGVVVVGALLGNMDKKPGPPASR